MLIAHLPAGYILAKLLSPRFIALKPNAAWFTGASVVGSVAPDFDMLYFHFVDNSQHNHHSYWTHFPVVWGLALFLTLLHFVFKPHTSKQLVFLVFCLSGFIHLLLDSIVGDIRWLAPWDQHPYSLFTVEPKYSIWYFNFILHWVFILEIGLIAWAWTLWRANRRLIKGEN